VTVRNMQFQAVVSAVTGATKEQPANIVHTWDGWVSKNVLHVVSRSGARAKDIWHFPLDKCQGATLFFKNSTGTAYCYTRPGPKDDFEAVLRGMNPRVTIENVSAINAEMFTRGTGCNHDTRNGSRYSVLADGEVTVTRAAGRVDYHSNQFHIGCPTDPDTVQVEGGTYAIQFEENNTGVRRVLVTPAANRETVLAVLRAHARVRGGCKDAEGINENLRLIASGAKVPDSVVEGTLRRAESYGTVLKGVDTALLEKAKYYHPEEVKYRAEVARVFAWVRDNMSPYLTENKDDGRIVILLPKKLGVPNWRTLFDFWNKEDGRLNLVRGVTEPIPAGELPEWAVEKIRAACLCGDVYHVIKNMVTASKLAVTIFEKECSVHHYPRRGRDVLLHNGRNPNDGFGRVAWNRWWENK